MASNHTSPASGSRERAGGSVLPVLLLIGRPAAGKSEVIRYLKSVPPEERAERLHVGEFHEIDDFPMIWSWFEEDDILARHGRARLHTDADGYFLDNFLWHLLIERLDLEYWKWLKEAAGGAERERATNERTAGADELLVPGGKTAIIEFARGSEHGGLREAFAHFSDALLRRAAVLYINVSFEESLRKNRRRFNPNKPYSILEHALPDEKLERMYRESDWEELPRSAEGSLELAGLHLPYVVMENEDDVTTQGGEPLGRRLEECLAELWTRASSLP